MKGKVAIIGECMLELSQRNGVEADGAQSMVLSYGGDTLNTAVYLARLGVDVDYVTALGDDEMSTWMMAQWAREGVGCDLVRCFKDSVPGMYMIRTDEFGERSFLYWRDNSPAKRLFDDEKYSRLLFSTLASYEWLYLSGITLALYSDKSRERLFKLLQNYRRDGGKIIFDGNYRPRLWSSQQAAQQACEKMFRLTDIALPTLEDEQQLFGDIDENSVVKRLRSWGVEEVGIKMGEVGCLVAAGDDTTLVESNKVAVVDTTSAGDSFNAGYLAARISGSQPAIAAKSGHKLASVVIQHKGAIISPELMPV